jgi:hypothetical protein
MLEEESKMKNEAPGAEEATLAVDEGHTFTRKLKHPAWNHCSFKT